MVYGMKKRKEEKRKNKRTILTNDGKVNLRNKRRPVSLYPLHLELKEFAQSTVRLDDLLLVLLPHELLLQDGEPLLQQRRVTAKKESALTYAPTFCPPRGRTESENGGKRKNVRFLLKQ